MKKVTTPNGVFGPYQTVEVLPDRYRCDGADLPFTVVGQGTVSDAHPGDFTPIAAPLPVPQTLTMRQAKLVLLDAGLLDYVNAAVSKADEATRIEWEYATEVSRTWPTLVAMATALGLDDFQLDQLFVQGAAL